MASRDKNSEAGNLRFLDFKGINFPATCCKMTEILSRSDDSICPDDLDDIKGELLFIRDALAKRTQDISEEMEALAELQDKPVHPASTSAMTDKKRSSAASASSNHKRREPEFGNRLAPDPKRIKSSSSDPSSSANSPAPASSSSSQTRKLGSELNVDKKSKIKSKHSKSDGGQESEIQLAKLKQDTSSKFWVAVDQYCAPITEQDISNLRDLSVPPEEDQELYKIPVLGRHYSYRWAQDDVGEEEKAPASGSSSTGSRKNKSSASTTTGATTTTTAAHTENLPLHGDSFEELSRHEACNLGPLTQRLVSALLEDKKSSNHDLLSTTTPSSPGGNGSTVQHDGSCHGNDRLPLVVKHNHTESSPPTSSPPSSSSIDPNSRDGNHPDCQRSWLLSNAKLLESRIHDQLVQLGLMEANEIVPAEDEEDEVLAELKKRQSELRAVSEYNRRLKLALVQRAEMEIEKQALMEKKRKADNDVIDFLKKMQTSKQKKKPLTRKEREAAYQAISARHTLKQRMEQLERATEELFASAQP